MADERRNNNPGRSSSGRPSSGRSGTGRTAGKPDDRGGSRGRSDTRGGRPDARRTDDRRSDGSSARARRDPAERTADQAAYDGPELPPEITGAELDKTILTQLKSLPEKLANRVARHLVAASYVIDDDPETAFQHARAARIRAPRIAVVREAAGESAYAAGHYAEALSDLRAAKRMNGASAYLPIMADCHRAMKQPEQALKLAKSPSVANFSSAAKAEMTIVEAGARRDLGQLDAALRTLELAPLNNKSRESWVVRLRYAYADTLAEAGRPQEAAEWFHRTHAIDSDEITDAAARAEQLESAP